MKTFLLTFFAIITSIALYSQSCPYLGPDQYLSCGVNSTTLTADLSQCSLGLNPNSTTNYSVSNISYSPDSYTSGTQVTNFTDQFGNINNDDGVSTNIPIPFNFCYFGQTYNSIYISSNNWIGFSAGQTTTWITTTIPNAGAGTPKNCIMGPWQDINPSLGGTIRWAVYGVAPCRRLVVSYYNIPMFSCSSLLYSSQIKIYESTNVIETHILNKPICSTWNSGNAVHGLHNLSGGNAVLVAGRNNTQWTATNEAVRFTPSGPIVNPVLTWYQVGNAVPIGTGNSITVTPPASGAEYTCHFVYPICNAGWSVCQNSSGNTPDTVFVQPGLPNLLQPTIDIINPSCQGLCDASITLTPSGVPPFNIVWSNGQTGLTINNLCSGSYTAQITDNSGCSVITPIINIVDPLLPSTGPISSTDTICIVSNFENYSVPNDPNLIYNWSSVGNIISGQNTNQIAIDWSSSPSGFINDAVSVIPIDANGCNGIPVYFDIFILDINPIIDVVGPLCSNDTCIELTANPIGGVFNGSDVFNGYFCPDDNNVGANDIVYTYILSGCSFNSIFTIAVNAQPDILSITPDNQLIEICEDDSIFISYSTLSNFSSNNIWFFNGDTIVSNYLNINWNWSEVGIWDISVISESNGCISDPEFTTVNIIQCPQTIYYIPNSFTPDGDEFNNLFILTFTDGFSPYEFHLEIFNRWGEIVFESFDSNVGWDGTYHNKLSPGGIYTWVVKYGNENNDGYHLINGHVNLIR